MYYIATAINGAVFGLCFFYLQEKGTFDWGGYGGLIAALIATTLTVYQQIKQSKLKKQIDDSKIKQQSQQDVMLAWEKLFDRQSSDIKDVRARLQVTEAHNRICERNNMLLVIQLTKAGIEVDAERIMNDLNEADLEFLKRDKKENNGEHHKAREKIENEEKDRP